MQPDFGKTATDYARHRHGFPDALFEMFSGLGIVVHDLDVVDLGTGTGSLARGMARRGAQVTGVDPSVDLTEEARRLDFEWGVATQYVNSTAEKTGLESGRFDLVTSGQSWWWFDRPCALAEVSRLLKPNGQVVICSFDWLPTHGNVVGLTEDLIMRHNPNWHMDGGDGTHPDFVSDLQLGGFVDVRSEFAAMDAVYTKEAWRGRVRASAGVGASLDPAAIDVFDSDLASALDSFTSNDPIAVPHALYVVVGTKPVG